jgi:hypothetical protein
MFVLGGFVAVCIALGDIVLGDIVLGDIVLGDIVLGDIVLGDIVSGEFGPQHRWIGNTKSANKR